jgi:hypothetical protein
LSRSHSRRSIAPDAEEKKRRGPRGRGPSRDSAGISGLR